MSEPALDSADLGAAIRRCADGDRVALRRIYEAESARMVGVALRILRRQTLAEEAVHDVFVQVWQRAGSFDAAKGDARSWLYTIVRNRALSILRGEGRLDHVDDFEPMGLESEEEAPDVVVQRLADGGRLRRCLERLDARRRELIVLAYAHGLSHGELAGRLKIPLGTIKSLIRRSLVVLKDCMT